MSEDKFVFIRYYKFAFSYCNGTVHLSNEEQNADDIYRTELETFETRESLKNQGIAEEEPCWCSK